jgi:hypothetical protein
MTKDEARKALADGKMLLFGVWHVSGRDRISFGCDEHDCCRDDYKDFDEFWDSWGYEIEDGARAV